MAIRNRLLLAILIASVFLFFATYPIRSRLWRSTAQMRAQREALQQREAASRQVEDLREQLLKALGALAENPHDEVSLLQASSVCGRLRLYPDAMFYAHQASEVAPDSSEPHRALADIHFTEGRYDLALKEYRNALKLNRRDFESGARLAYLYIKLGWSSETRKLLDELQGSGIDPSRLALLKAMFAYQNADFTIANEMLNQALKGRSNQGDVYALLASIHKDQASQEKALEEIERAIESNPQEPRYHIIHGQVLLSVPQPELIPRARRAFEKALELSPDNVEGLYGLAQCAKRLRHEDESLRYYEQIRQIAPGHTVVLAELSQLLARKGRRAEAQAMMERYRIALRDQSYIKGAHIRVAMVPRDYRAHFQLGRLHLKAHDFPRAIVELKRSLELKAHDRQVKRVLADALATAGRYDESRQIAPPRPLPEVESELASLDLRPHG